MDKNMNTSSLAMSAPKLLHREDQVVIKPLVNFFII